MLTDTGLLVSPADFAGFTVPSIFKSFFLIFGGTGTVVNDVRATITYSSVTVNNSTGAVPVPAASPLMPTALGLVMIVRKQRLLRLLGLLALGVILHT